MNLKSSSAKRSSSQLFLQAFTVLVLVLFRGINFIISIPEIILFVLLIVQ